MTRRLKKLIKEFLFSEDNRRQVTLGTNVRLNPQEHRLELKLTSGGYPLTANLYAKTRLTSPATAKRWINFQADVVNKSVGGTEVTAVRYRLSPDGVAELWWDGAAWTAAAPGQWNTEAQVANNIATFASRSIQVILNLSTTDGGQTPEVSCVKILWESDIEFQQEYIARSLLPAMREELRPIGELALDLTASTTTVDLNQIETAYDFMGLDSAYNVTDDPDKLVDIGASYNINTKVVTLTGPVGPGKQLLIRFAYRPAVMITRSQDFTELAKVPAICIESIVQDKKRTIQPGPHVINKETGDGWQLKDGFQSDINFTVRFTADKARDLDALGDQLKQFFLDRLLLARGQDEFVRLYTLEEYSHQPSALQSELHSARLRARISNAVFYVKEAVPVVATQRLIVTGGNVDFQV